MKDEERKAYFKELSEQYKLLDDLLRKIVLGFINEKRRRLPQNGYPLYEIRDSILYRFGSIWFHMDLLIKIEQGIDRYTGSKVSELDVHDKSIFSYSQQQLHLFEDIIFHTISMFDYLANFIGFVCLGNNKGKIKWNGLGKAANDKNNIFNDTKVASLIRTHHRIFVDLLYSYRSTLIHHVSETANATYTIRGTQSALKGFFRVWCPDKFDKSFRKRLNWTKKCQKDQMTLIDIAVRLTQESFSIVNELVESIKESKGFESLDSQP